MNAVETLKALTEIQTALQVVKDKAVNAANKMGGTKSTEGSYMSSCFDDMVRWDKRINVIKEFISYKDQPLAIIDGESIRAASDNERLKFFLNKMELRDVRYTDSDIMGFIASQH